MPKCGHDEKGPHLRATLSRIHIVMKKSDADCVVVVIFIQNGQQTEDERSETDEYDHAGGAFVVTQLGR